MCKDILKTLTNEQLNLLAYAKVLNGLSGYHSRHMKIETFEFTKDWNAEQALLALAVLPSGTVIKDCKGLLLQRTSTGYSGKYPEDFKWSSVKFFVSDNYGPYNFVASPGARAVITLPPLPRTLDEFRQATAHGRKFQVQNQRKNFCRVYGGGHLSVQDELELCHALSDSYWSITEMT